MTDKAKLPYIDKNNPPFFELNIEDKYTIRFQKTWQQKDGQYAYACIGTIKELQEMQEHLDDVFPTNRTTS